MTVTTCAGVPADRLKLDGSPAIAQFEATTGIAGDGAGHFYLADARAVPRSSRMDRSTPPPGGEWSGLTTGFGAWAWVEPRNDLAAGGGFVFFTRGSQIPRLETATGLVVTWVIGYFSSTARE